MPEKYTISDLTELILKFISIPAIVAITAKIAVQIRQKKATLVGSAVSMCTGLSVAYIIAPYIHNNFDDDIHGILIGLSAILADKIMEYFVFSFKIGDLLDKIFEKILGRFDDKKGEE